MHCLVTYQCTQECDHCFVFGSPRAQVVFSGDRLTQLIEQCRAVGTVEWIFFEGGEPLLYYPVLMRGVRRAAQPGFRVGLVTTACWATSLDDALLCLEGLGPGCVQALSVSSDDLHHGADAVALQRIDSAIAGMRATSCHTRDALRRWRRHQSFGNLPSGSSTASRGSARFSHHGVQ